MEAIQKTPNMNIPQPETYGLSLSALRRLGAITTQTVVDVEVLQAHETQVRDEFNSAVFEGLSSDESYGGVLQVTKFDTRKIIDGKVMSADLQSTVTELLENGLESSKQASRFDQRVVNQMVRDGNDLENAEQVELMLAGKTDYNTRIVVSLLPEEAIERDGEEFWKNIGYIPGKKTAYIQLYHYSSEGELVTGSLSVDMSDKTRWRNLFAKHGVEIPEDETTDNWLQYAITGEMSEEEAKEFALEIRREYEGRVVSENIDTVDTIEANQEAIDRVFEEMYLPIVDSLAIGEKTPEMKEIVDAFLANSQYFNSETRSDLMRASNKAGFTDSDAKLLHQLVIYSSIEMFRSSLEGHSVQEVQQDMSEFAQMAVQENLANVMALFALGGAKEGRTYSSCGRMIDFAEMLKELTGSQEDQTPQEVFGRGARRKKRMNCPHCTAVVFDDPCANGLSCWDCRAKVFSENAIYKGNGGSRKKKEGQKDQSADILYFQPKKDSPKADKLVAESVKVT
ncbi:MAG: hypothetical protein AAB423_03185 [Patescibacteria group bacterium]